MTRKILISSPVRQKPAILERFLESLAALHVYDLQISCRFIDDNTNSDSSESLRQFSPREWLDVTIVPYEGPSPVVVELEEARHNWKEEIVWKVAAMKDGILAYAMEAGFDHVFLVDSDLVLHPETLKQLVDTGKDIVSTIYWTRWQPDTLAMPQVWLHGEYELHPLERNIQLSERERRRQVEQFIYKLRQPGLYEVGGLGACTLISRKALLAGVRFAEIKSLTYWGEDRHFCLRAAALGFDLFVETTYPAYHIYRDDDLEGVEMYYLGESEIARPLPDGDESDLYGQAQRLLSYGYEELAIDHLERFIAQGSGSQLERVDACLLVDAYYGRNGLADKGQTMLLNVSHTLQRAEIFCRLGAKCMDEEKWNEAIVWFKLALQAERPDDWEASTDSTSWTWKPHIQLCVCYSRLGQLQLAYEHNEKGMMFDAGNSSMLYNREYLRSLLEPTV